MSTEKRWTEFSVALKKFIFSKVKDNTVADDILQEVFIKIHLHKNKIQKKESLKSWLFSIANHSTIDYFRQKNMPVPDQIGIHLIQETSSDGHNRSDCLLPLIIALPKKYKETLLLSEIKGLKQKEVAEQLTISLTAAKSRIQRGRDLLKQGFINCCDYQIDKKGYLKVEDKNLEDCKVCH